MFLCYRRLKKKKCLWFKLFFKIKYNLFNLKKLYSNPRNELDLNIISLKKCHSNHNYDFLDFNIISLNQIKFILFKEIMFKSKKFFLYHILTV